MLETSRVLIVDDSPAEALPLLLALGRAGIGAVYVRGNKLEELPEQPLKGIRVAFLDMDLGVGGESKNKISAVIAVLRRLFEEGSNSVVFVIWTKHEDLVEDFRRALVDTLPRLRPALLITMTKTFDYENVDWPAEGPTPKDYDKAIRNLATKGAPLDTVWAWEQIVHDSASETTAAIGELVSLRAGPCTLPADSDDPKWLVCLGQVLARLLNSAGGEASDKADAGRFLLEALSRIQYDRLQTEALHSGEPFSAEAFLGHSPGKVPADEAVKLNTMILTEADVSDDRKVRPGNVYISRVDEGVKCPLAVLNIDYRRLIGELLSADPDQYRLEQLEQRLRQENKASEGDTAHASMVERQAQLLGACTPVLLELTPACDYSQGKQRVARFVAGALIPPELRKSIKRAAYFIQIEEVEIKELNQSRILAFDSRYQFGIENPMDSINSKPLLRLREHLLVDIQNKVAAHSSRLGYLSVR